MDEDLIRNVLHHFGQPGGWPPGSFIANMLRAYQGADPGNRARIRLGFPELAEAMDIVMDEPFGIEKLQAQLQEDPRE